MGLDMYLFKREDIDKGYWRKANAIHGWFVNNVQSGEDDCGSYYVSKEKLLQLKADCQAVLDDNSKAADLLPPTPGFFFGSYDINNEYFNDLRHTVDIISQLEKDDDFDNIYYSSSW